MHTTNVRSIVVPGAESASNAPPVPPRRKKRKAKPAAIAKSAEEETSPTRLRKPDRKRLAPLPPPRAIRRIKSHVAKDQPQETASNVQTVDDAEETLDSLSSIERESGESSQPPSLQSRNVVSAPTEKNQKNDRQSGRPFAVETRNKYPPLFFTLHDFQNVMSNTLQQRDDNDANDDGCKPSVGLSSSFHESLSDKFRGSFREFFERPSLDDEEGNLCFRVTTTNLPFERCLDRLIENIDESSRFIFEDYIDRSSKMNVRQSAGPMCCDSFQEEAATVPPRLAKVRFVIESPSSSTPDYELENDDEATCDSLQNIDPLVDEEVGEVNWNRGPCVQLTEITDDMDCTNASQAFGQVQDLQEDLPDEFGDVPFSSILKTSSLEDATNFIEAIDEGLSSQRGRVNSNDPQDQLSLCSEEELKVEEELADVSETELKTERCPTASDQTVKDNKQYLGEEGLSNDGCETEKNNAKTEETVSADTVDSKWELIRNKINANFVQGDSTTCENEYPTTEINSEKSTINGTKVSDQQPTIKNEVENNVLKEHLLSSRIETEASGEEVSSAEGDVEIDKQQAKTYSPDKSTGEYRRKLFVNESLRSMINRCDFTSNDLADESEDSDAQMDDDHDYDLDTGGIISSDREISRNDAKYEVRVIENQNKISKPGCFEKRESIGASVNIRRSSFLENMLSEDSDQAWTSCKIVAVHLKSPARHDEVRPSSREREKKTLADDDGLNESRKIDPETGSGRVETTLVNPTAAKKTNMGETSGRTAGEVKCDVLNELLSNFSNIRLKPVNSERRSAAESHHPRVTSPPRRKNDDEDEGTESLSDSRVESLKDRSDPCDSSVETERRTMNLKLGISSAGRQWQHAASLTTRRIRNDQDNEWQEKSKELGNVTRPQVTENFTKLPDDSGVSSDGNESEEVVTVNRVEGTKSEDDHSELSESSSSMKRRKGLVERSKSDDEAGKSEASCVERLQTVDCSEKTDAKKYGSRDRGAYARQLELSGDKSAIVRRIPRPHCNNNDNNRAVTPVAVSDDQSRNDTVTMITPGRVRSFVKYYEIRREATIDKDSKTSDRVDKDPVPGHQSVFSIRRGFEARSSDNNHREPIADQDLERSSGTASTAIVHQEFLVTREISSRSADRVEDHCVEVRKQRMHLSTNLSVSDSCQSTHPEGKTKRKKSVQFQSGFTVIGAKSPGENSSAGNNPAGQDKNKSADRPTLKDSLFTEKEVDSRAGQSEDLLQADPRSFEERNAAAQMQAAAKCEECSGINRFVPKPETPRLVFYCTV